MPLVYVQGYDLPNPPSLPPITHFTLTCLSPSLFPKLPLHVKDVRDASLLYPGLRSSQPFHPNSFHSYLLKFFSIFKASSPCPRHNRCHSSMSRAMIFPILPPLTHFTLTCWSPSPFPMLPLRVQDVRDAAHLYPRLWSSQTADSKPISG